LFEYSSGSCTRLAKLGIGERREWHDYARRNREVAAADEDSYRNDEEKKQGICGRVLRKKRRIHDDLDADSWSDHDEIDRSEAVGSKD